MDSFPRSASRGYYEKDKTAHLHTTSGSRPESLGETVPRGGVFFDNCTRHVQLRGLVSSNAAFYCPRRDKPTAVSPTM